MPRVELNTKEKREGFVNWLSAKVSKEEAFKLEQATPTWDGDGLYEVWQINKGSLNEPMVIYRWTNYGAIPDAQISEVFFGSEIEDDLREAGVIFDAAKPSAEEVRIRKESHIPYYGD